MDEEQRLPLALAQRVDGRIRWSGCLAAGSQGTVTHLRLQAVLAAVQVSWHPQMAPACGSFFRAAELRHVTQPAFGPPDPRP